MGEVSIDQGKGWSMELVEERRVGALGSWTEANEGCNVVTMVASASCGPQLLADGKEAGNGGGVAGMRPSI